MNVHFDLLHHTNDFCTKLRQDGWQLNGEDGVKCLDAQHPLVRDEAAARNRLQTLGLLTSSQVRIEFSPARFARPARLPAR